MEATSRQPGLERYLGWYLDIGSTLSANMSQAYYRLISMEQFFQLSGESSMEYGLQLPYTEYSDHRS